VQELLPGLGAVEPRRWSSFSVEPSRPVTQPPGEERVGRRGLECSLLSADSTDLELAWEQRMSPERLRSSAAWRLRGGWPVAR
jgi:hypothetical protein